MSEEDPIQLIKEINPNMPPEQAVQNVRRFNKLEYNRSKKPVYQARDELLKKYGYKPNEWVYFTNHFPLDGKENVDEADLASLARPFPKGVEFLILPGGFVGGISGIPGTTSSWGVAQYKFREDDYTVYIRVAIVPKALHRGK